MCLAIYKPAGVVVPREAYQNGFRSNSHGAGFSCVDGGKLVTVKGLFTFDEFWSAFERRQDLQAAVHFRWATSGLRDVDNCHPFHVSDDTTLIHNGVLSIARNIDADRSDTWHYCHQVLQPMAERDPDFFLRPDVRFMGEAAIGNDKFVFLRSDGRHAIWNEECGVWDGDAWFSNETYISDYTRRVWSPTAETTSRSRSKWWHVEDDTPAWTNDQPSDSEWYDYLTERHRRAYEDMLDDGFTIKELDELIALEGEEALLEYTNDYGG